jgi:hypothetical protein
MAFVATLTGTARSCTLTSGSSSMIVSSNTGLVVGATIQGTGIPTGTRIGTINGTTVTMVNASGVAVNATVGGAQNLIFSSVYGSTLTITLTASGDVGTWQQVFNAGYGLLQGSRQLFHPGGLTITFGSIVAGAIFNHEDWTVEFGTGGRMLFDSGLLAGEQRGGYTTAGTLLIKADGPTFVFNNWNNASAGGSSMFLNTGNLLTQGGTFRMHNPRFVVRTGSNMCPAFTSVRDLMIVENLILDYDGDNGPNASIGCGYGTILNPKIIKANSGLARTNTTSSGSIIGLYYLGLFTDSPQAKFSIPDGFTMDGYAPQITSTQFLGGFQSNTTETYSNIDLSSAGWGLTDLITRYQRFGGTNVIRFPRTVTFEFNDSVGTNLTDVTLFIRSGATTIVNAVQAGDYSANTQALILNWTTTTLSYRVADNSVNTISQIAQFRKNGFISQSVSYSLNTALYSQPIFMLADPAYGSVTPAQAAALTGITLDFTNRVVTGSAARNLDQLYAFGQHSLALTANSAQADFQVSNGGVYNLLNTWRLLWTTGALTMGTYNRTFNSSTQWRFQNGASLTLDKDDVTWTPAARGDVFQFETGSTFNITNGSVLTFAPTTAIGYGTATTSEFRSGSTLNMSDSTLIVNAPTAGSGTYFSNTEAGATWNITNSTWTFNAPSGGGQPQIAIHAYFLPASNINGLTINGTSTNVVWQMGFTSNNSKMVGFRYGGAIFGNGSSNILMDTYTYTGTALTIPNTFGSLNKWYFVDPVMNAGGAFRWNAGATANGQESFFGVVGFRPTITMDKTGYAPRVRFTPSAMATRYPSFQVQSTAFGTLPLTQFFKDPTFMGANDGFLPFVDSLDSKTVINTINWTVNARQAGWIDQTVTFNAANARRGNVTSTFSGAVDSNYVNATTALADSALITVNTTTKTIAPVSGNLSWSPQRLYNALKNWWATYASNTDFLANTGGGFLDLGDYNTSSTLKFQAGNSNDALTNVRTTGLINAPINDIPVTDANGTSTIWEFGSTSEPVVAGTSVALYDASGNTVYYQAVTTDGVYKKYIPTGTIGTYYYAIERYGYKREEGNFPANAGGNLFYVPNYSEDVGITDTKTNVVAYTTLSTTSQIYDATAYFRLSETGIKLGQLVARDGLYLDFGTYNVKIKDDASAIVGVASGTITYKSIVVNETTKYNAMKATPPATITPTDTEIINVLIEDANGDSKLSILGGDNTGYELWKVTTATPTDNYATGTLLTTLATNDEVYRFIGISGYDIVGRDTSSGVRRRSSMLKGSYEQAFYVGNQIQLATDAPQLLATIDKIDELTLKVDTNLDVKVSTRLADADYIDPATAQQIWEYTTRTLTSAGASGATLAEIEASTILAMKSDVQAVETKVDALPTLAEMESVDSNLAKQDQLQSVNSIVQSTEDTVNSLAGVDFDGMTDSLSAISDKVDTKPSLSDIENSTILAKENTSQAIKDKVDTLENTDLTGVTENLTIINNGVKKASKTIPHNQNLI